ncbi:DinB family protein [Guptibacillus hwajinpoensis]|uniref:DinB family protein n=1 Tax=Guptibacillus hwajinpoensis TaxID=208199 RepID=UPI001CD6454C|nr:DinB family protein [Pseudalkalibacillus hwajinpoensis]MCA0993231.1 DinB family protein [Pseudalkalibacillus hwajinpoensis]
MTDERSVLNDYASLINWLESTAMEMNETIFFQPIKQGKWSPAEILSHIMMWDNYLLKERIPFIEMEANLPKLDNVEEVNQRSAEYALSGLNKENLVAETVQARRQVVARLQQFEPIQWSNTFYIEKYPICLTSYIKGLIEHDDHHKLQVEVFMNEQGFSLSHFTL